MKDQEAQGASRQDAPRQDQAGSTAQSRPLVPPSQPTQPLKQLRANEETLAKIDPRLRKIYEHYKTWARVAKKFGYTERGIAWWSKNGIPACREGKVDEVVREIEGKKARK